MPHRTFKKISNFISEFNVSFSFNKEDMVMIIKSEVSSNIFLLKNSVLNYQWMIKITLFNQLTEQYLKKMV